MPSENDIEYFARRLRIERRMAHQAVDEAARQLHIRLASEYARRARKSGVYVIGA